MKAYFTYLFLFLGLVCFGQNINTRSLDSLVSSWDTPNSPGGYLALFEDGEQVYSKGFGFANLELKEPFTEQTVFPIASISKHITAICLLKLVENGQLDLSQSIVDFFPELSDYASEVTVSDLLNHTSGIGSWTGAATMRGYRIHEFKMPPIEWLTEHGHLEFSPRTKYSYSNTAFYLAGLIIERTTSKSLAEFAHTEFFSKLGMKNTFYSGDSNKPIANKAQGYVLNAQNEYIIRNSMARYMGPVGVYTTISDFRIWDNAIQNNLILNPELLKLIRTSYQLRDGTKTNYGFGQVINEINGTKVEYHGGGDYDWGYKCYFERYPDHNLTFIFFSNKSDLDRDESVQAIRSCLLNGQLTNEVKKKAKPSKVKTKKVKNLSFYEGTYYSKSIDAHYILRITNDNELELTTGEIDPQILTWYNKETAYAKVYYIQKMRLSATAPNLRFKFKNNKVVGFELDAGGVNKIPFKKMK